MWYIELDSFLPGGLMTIRGVFMTLVYLLWIVFIFAGWWFVYSYHVHSQAVVGLLVVATIMVAFPLIGDIRDFVSRIHDQTPEPG